jgi:L-alanine-DL-glutamate epimerase-like enolase superfamily enzyme
MRYLGEHHANGSAPTWKFLTALTIGQVAGFGAASLTRKAFQREPCSTREASEFFVGAGVFTIAAGLAWVFLTRHGRS